MIRLFLLVLLLVATLVAYPWLAVLAGLLAVAAGAVVLAGRWPQRRRKAPTVVVGAGRRVGLSAERRRALRLAWAELHRIERQHGLPPTRPPD